MFIFLSTLFFIVQLKGVPAGEVKAKIDDLITSLDLKDAREKRGNQLSGGMKRKLSVAMALVGNNKVLTVTIYKEHCNIVNHVHQLWFLCPFGLDFKTV